MTSINKTSRWRTLFFIPVFNQIDEFPSLLEELRRTGPPCDTVLLVNNGSDDGSGELVRSSGFPFLDLEQNRGIGYSYRMALDWALERDFDLFGTMAGNGKMLPAEMPRVLEPLRQGRADYVTGSRYLPGGNSPNLPPFRRLTIPAVNLFAGLLTGVRLTDATCGYRAYRLSFIRQAQFDWRASWLDTYGLEYYLYAQALLDPGMRCLEVPITMRYPARGRRYSKIRPGVDWWAMLKPWLVARLEKGIRR